MKCRVHTRDSWTLQSGTIAIQSFDLHGEVSGRIEGKLWKGPGVIGLRENTIFWVDLRDTSNVHRDTAGQD